MITYKLLNWLHIYLLIIKIVENFIIGNVNNKAIITIIFDTFYDGVWLKGSILSKIDQQIYV